MDDDSSRAAELARLREDYQAAIDQTKAILMTNGMDSPEFSAAKQIAAQLWQAIQAIDPGANKGGPA